MTEWDTERSGGGHGSPSATAHHRRRDISFTLTAGTITGSSANGAASRHAAAPARLAAPTSGTPRLRPYLRELPTPAHTVGASSNRVISTRPLRPAHLRMLALAPDRLERR